MGATVALIEALGDRDRIDCEEVHVYGNVIHAAPTESDRDVVVPVQNVAGIEGDDVEQRVARIESPGGQYTELVMDIS